MEVESPQWEVFIYTQCVPGWIASLGLCLVWVFGTPQFPLNPLNPFFLFQPPGFFSMFLCVWVFAHSIPSAWEALPLFLIVISSFFVTGMNVTSWGKASFHGLPPPSIRQVLLLQILMEPLLPPEHVCPREIIVPTLCEQLALSPEVSGLETLFLLITEIPEHSQFSLNTCKEDVHRAGRGSFWGRAVGTREKSTFAQTGKLGSCLSLSLSPTGSPPPRKGFEKAT